MVEVQRIAALWDDVVHQLQSCENSVEQTRTAAALIGLLDDVRDRLRGVRNEGICRQKRTGLTAAAIGDRCGLSATQVKDILRKGTAQHDCITEENVS